ncbi:MAG: Dabb family protein [Planctomycetes bacterium]|nr:Dabb family protein [Planctomycetota bacterium]
MPKNPGLVHDVYFALVDASPAARQTLIDACHDKLAGIAGVESLVAGNRDEELTRDVNDRDYDVSLHVRFTDRAAHDAYQTAPEHLQFIAANRDNWKSVRVFDTVLVTR